jgi:hypothetical protein
MIQSDTIRSNLSNPISAIHFPNQVSFLSVQWTPPHMSYPTTLDSILTHRPHIPIPKNPKQLPASTISPLSSQLKPKRRVEARDRETGVPDSLLSFPKRYVVVTIESERNERRDRESANQIGRMRRERRKKEEGARKASQKPGCQRNASSCKQDICLP